MSMHNGPALNGNLEYQDRVIAFVDILGFSALTLESGSDPVALARIAELIKTNSIFEYFYSKVLEFGNATFFSDSFVVSMEPSQAWYLFRHTGQLCRYLLLRGLPCRGAITNGKLYHDGKIVVGPALVQAYHLEQVARYPRVIVEESASALWRDDAHAWELDCLMRSDGGSYSYIDIFNPRWADEFVPWPDDVPTDNHVFIEAASAEIATGLSRYSDDGKVLEKYKWLAAECGRYQAAR
jgi:hypothetical protein